MLERVTRAIQAELRRQDCLFDPDGEDLSSLMMYTGAKADMAAVVRAAIAAMREPTEAMHEAWADAEDADDHPAECFINPRRYAAMIDAALVAGQKGAA